MAVVATLTKGYNLDYIWKQVDRGPAKDAASYYIQASETGGEPPGRWWGPGAQALGFEPGQTVERQPYDLLFGQRKAPDGTRLGKPPDGGRQAADLYARLLAAVRGLAQLGAVGGFTLAEQQVVRLALDELAGLEAEGLGARAPPAAGRFPASLAGLKVVAGRVLGRAAIDLLPDVIQVIALGQGRHHRHRLIHRQPQPGFHDHQDDAWV